MKQSEKQIAFLKNIKKEKRIILLFQISLTIIFFLSWEFLSSKGYINSFIYSSPSKIIITIKDLFISNNILKHILATVTECLIAFILGTSLGFGIAIIFYLFPITIKIFDPFLTILNSLPKVALGPIIIIMAGANPKSIILTALLTNIVVNISTIYNGFTNTDEVKIKLFKTFKASKRQMLHYLVIPSAYPTIITSLKLNISLTLIGVIMGEFLVSQKGIGYLIIYGTQVFNLNLVMSGIFILLFISYILYKFVIILEKRLTQSK